MNYKDTIVGLLKSEKKNEAIEYLTLMTRSQKLVVKYENNVTDNNSKSDVYLYLKNKTFLNAHLIKRGLASADKNGDYKYCKMFIKYEEQAKKSGYGAPTS